MENSESRSLAVSALTILEVRSAIRRRQHAGDILQADADSAVSSLQTEVGRIVEYAITPSVTAEAARLIDTHVLRALDAIQLATGVIARDALPAGQACLFVASDLKLLNAAKAERFATWDPAFGFPIA